MVRDSGTLRFALLLPVFQLVLFGLIDTNVRHVPTVVFDQSRTQESRELRGRLRRPPASSTWSRDVDSRDELRAEIVAGHASVGHRDPARLRAPAPRRRDRRRPGADRRLGLERSPRRRWRPPTGWRSSRSLAELLRARRAAPSRRIAAAAAACSSTPTRAAPTCSSRGWSRSCSPSRARCWRAFSIVRERERGTLEQLMVTPVSPLGVVLGKLVPYLVLAFVQLLLVLVLMTIVFRVPIHGSLVLLLGAVGRLPRSPCSRSASSSRRAPRRRWRRSSWRR